MLTAAGMMWSSPPLAMSSSGARSGLSKWTRVAACGLKFAKAPSREDVPGRGYVAAVVDLLGLGFGEGVGERVVELVRGQRYGAAAVGRVA